MMVSMSQSCKSVYSRLISTKSWGKPRGGGMGSDVERGRVLASAWNMRHWCSWWERVGVNTCLCPPE